MPAAEGVTSRAHARMLPAFDLLYLTGQLTGQSVCFCEAVKQETITEKEASRIFACLI